MRSAGIDPNYICLVGGQSHTEGMIQEELATAISFRNYECGLVECNEGVIYRDMDAIILSWKEKIRVKCNDENNVHVFP